MKRLPALAGALAFLCTAVQAGAQTYQHQRAASGENPGGLVGRHIPHQLEFNQMTRPQLARWLRRQLAHDNGAIRWFERHLEITHTLRFGERLGEQRFVLYGRTEFVASVQHGRWRHELRWFRTSHRIVSRHLAAVQRQIEVLATPQTWLDAVALVGRYFGADVAAWERSCSQPTSEGGWGRWVPNTQGSGAGGWLQFLEGTFNGVIDSAVASARSRGMYVPDAARSWYSPLGQAIAGAQMLADGRRGEWSGSGC